MRIRKVVSRVKAARRAVVGLELMERRELLTVGADRHVLLLSVDGMHQADLVNRALAADLTTIRNLAHSGTDYQNASTSSPSDSFPGTLSYLTGATPGTTGVFYDASYDRSLYAPGTSNPASATPGTAVTYDESIDKNSTLLSGGGNFDASSIDPTQLPVDSKGNPVYPSTYLKVNTIFNVAADAGLHTAFSDKHPAYQLANGHNGGGVQDLYTPEIAANVALLDPTTNKTVSADALLAANPFTDVSKYTLVDASTDPLGPTDPNLESTVNNLLLTERYDDLKVQAILNEIDGLNSRGTTAAAIPNLFGMNFQAVSVAEKYFQGGIALLSNGKVAIPSQILQAAFLHTDASVGKIVSELHKAGIWDKTMLVVTAKHGQSPIEGSAGLMKDSTLPDLLANAGIQVANATQDDVSLIWLQNQSQTAAAAAAIINFQKTGTITVYQQGGPITIPASKVIDHVIFGAGLPYHGLGDPLKNSRTPDLVVTLKPGFIWVGNVNSHFKRAEHGGFSADDTHVPLIVAGGVNAEHGKSVVTHVSTRQIAVSSLLALGLDPRKLQGAVADKTQALPGVKLHF